MDHQTKYARVGNYIISLDYIHGIMSAKTDVKETPYHIYITYTDKTTCVLECVNLEDKNAVMDRLAQELKAI